MAKAKLDKIHLWWQNDPAESFWLEVTDRSDIGINLKAPQTSEHGKAFWSYSLIKFVNPGDIIYHYDKKKRAITSKSTATGKYWEDSIVWAARGIYAREAGIEPHTRAGWYLGLENYQELKQPLKLETIREIQGQIIKEENKLISDVGKPIYFPFEIGNLRRPIRPMQGYLFKLPAFFTQLFDELRINRPTSLGEIRNNYDIHQFVGTAYRFADEETSVAKSDPFDKDPSLVERALDGHAKTQNALARFILDEKITPLSPAPNDPDFDLAWNIKGELWVAEIKSINVHNEEKQLRLGLGQLLRYCQILGSNKKVRGVLVMEKAPKDESWVTLCKEHNIILVWPATWKDQLKTAFG